MHLYLVTHAHTEQVEGVPSDAWRLSAHGVEQATSLAAAPFWHFVDRVVISSEPKTWLTIAGVATSRSLPVWIDSRFDELRRGGWIEDYAAQVATVFAKPTCNVNGWESVEDVRQRSRAALAEVQRRFAGERLVLVGHGLCLSILRADILGDEQVDYAAWQRLAFGSYALIALSPPALLADFVLSPSIVR